MKLKTKEEFRKRRHNRLRRKIGGTSERPRLSIHRSNQQMYVQFIDDQAEKTLAAASTMMPGIKSGKGRVSLGEISKLGKTVADLAKEKGIKEVVFDRGGCRYAGKVKALAEAAREGGLKF